MLLTEQQQVKKEKKQATGLLDTKLETPNANFGKQVSMPYDSTLSQGGTNQWNVMGDVVRQSFLNSGVDVPRNQLFPQDVRLVTTENLMRSGNPHADTDAYQKDYLERETGMNWGYEIPIDNSNQDGTRLDAYGKFLPSDQQIYDKYAGVDYFGNEAMLGLTKMGAKVNKPQSRFKFNKGTQRGLLQPVMNITGHEYAHYLDSVFSGGRVMLSSVTEELLDDAYQANQKLPSQKELYERWMNDPRTEHLDVADNLNLKPSAQINPREVLGKFYTESMVNSGGNFENFAENIARSLGTFMGSQHLDEGHSENIMVQNKDVMRSIAKLLNNMEF